MATTADRLALLQRTKAGQRALLEKMYPDLDFSTVPFREYGRLFTGRKYVPGFVGGWKAYGRSNSEDASTRDILPDYSGNGRDIKLHNFAFSDGGTSGWGGGIPMLKFFNSILPNMQIDGFNYGKEKVSQISRNKYKITVSDGDIYLYVAAGETWNAGAHDMPGFIVRVTANTAKVRLNIYSGDNFSTRNIMDLKEGNNIIPSSQVTLSGDTSAGYVTIMRMYVAEGFPSDGVIVEFLPEYPGALVSDGVDDYGQCVKDFALPEDYTIVAVRRRLGGRSVLAGKSRDSKNGAFLFEYENLTYNYGISTGVTGHVPELFSYQTKTSYNGVNLNVGGGTDTEEDKLMLFMMRPNADRWSFYAFYDLRIYDHSLTAEELQLVKDEMMSDYENATGGGYR